ncbi:MAG: isochorismatase family protein, partial [Methanocella sp.]
MQTALLLVDIQNDYFRGGKNELVEPVKAGSKAKQLLDAFRERKVPVVHVQHISIKPGATFFLPDTPGAEINDIVRPLAGETVIRKRSPNSFRNTGLLQTLR